MRKYRVVQLTPSITYGDAVSNDVLAMSDVMTKNGFENVIVVISVQKKLEDKVIILDDFKPNPNDIFIYHMSIGSVLTEFVINASVHKKLMVYHNITPAKFFSYIPNVAEPCSEGRSQLKLLKDHIEFAICDSDYNKEELDEIGFKKTATLPIIFDDNDYRNTIPSQQMLKKYQNDGFTNILFVGRIAPNKKQEDIIASYHIYNKYINPNSRLILIGSSSSMDAYKTSLETYISDNNVKNVIFPGHISFSEIISYYKLADVFLCESEHEGFCVPLLEAMFFDIPIIAYKSSAIPYTLGNSGIIFTEKDHRLVAELIDYVVSNDDFKNEIIKGQQMRLKDFEINKVKNKFLTLIKPYITETE